MCWYTGKFGEGWRGRFGEGSRGAALVRDQEGEVWKVIERGKYGEGWGGRFGEGWGGRFGEGWEHHPNQGLLVGQKQS